MRRIHALQFALQSSDLAVVVNKLVAKRFEVLDEFLIAFLIFLLQLNLLRRHPLGVDLAAGRQQLKCLSMSDGDCRLNPLCLRLLVRSLLLPDSTNVLLVFKCWM